MENKHYETAYDLHTHTTFSHGKGAIEDNVCAALDRRLTHIAISDHGPGHLFYRVKRNDIQVMREEINRLQELHPQIKIHLSIEANITKSGNHLDITPEEVSQFDFILAGYHWGLVGAYGISNSLWSCGLKVGEKRQRTKNTDMIVQALYKNKIAILTHPGEKGPFDIRAIAEACEDRNTLMEINALHNHMTVEEIKIAADTQVQFIINSDAHEPKRIGEFQGALDRAIEGGLDLSRIVNLREIK